MPTNPAAPSFFSTPLHRLRLPRVRRRGTADKNKSDDAAHSFRLVSEAYRILTSPDSKQQYDRTRRYTIETPPSHGAASAGGRGGRGSGRAGGSNFASTGGGGGGGSGAAAPRYYW